MKMFVQKKWGHEFWIENNDQYCGKHLHVLPHKFCSVHYHKIKKETFYIISGELLLSYSSSLDKADWLSGNTENKILKVGDHITIEPYIAHRFSSTLEIPCDFVEISTHHDDNDSYRIIESF